MYQNLKLALALPPHVNENNNKQVSKHLSETESVHYLLLPDSKDDYIDKEIELGVANLQAVIELGWMIREKNAVPLKVCVCMYNTLKLSRFSVTFLAQLCD